MVPRVVTRLLPLIAALFAAAGGGRLSAADATNLSQGHLIRRWDNEAGLFTTGVTSVSQDKSGFLWLGTFSELLRFDGARFLNAAEMGIGWKEGTGVFTLRQSSDGRVFGSTLGALFLIGEDKVQMIEVPEDLAGVEIRSIAVTADGWVYFGGERGVGRYRDGIFEKVLVELAGADTETYRVAVDGVGNPWASRSEFLAKLTETQSEMVPLPVAPEERQVVGLEPSLSGGIWVALPHEVRKLERGNWVVRHERPAGFDNEVVAMKETKRGDLWVGSYTKGIFIVGRDGALTTTQPEDEVENSTVLDMFEDFDGTIWTGSNGGPLMQFRRKVVASFYRKHGLIQPVVNTIAEIGGGKFWVGTHGGGVQMFDGKSFAPPVEAPAAELREGAWVLSALVDRSGETWFGMYGKSLTRGRVGEWSSVPYEVVGSGSVLGLMQGRNGDIWIGGNRVLARYDGTTFHRYEALSGLPQTVVHGMAEDLEGRLWLLDFKREVYRQAGDKFEQVRLPDGKPIDFAEAIHIDARGVVWLGASDGALHRLEGGAAARVDKELGFPMEPCRTILEDADGFFWMITGKGVYRFSRESLDRAALSRARIEDWIRLDTSDGMRSAIGREIFKPAAIIASDGRIFAATSRGIAVIDPKAMEARPAPRVCLIEEVYVNQEHHPFFTGLPARLVLESGIRKLVVNFTSPQLSIPERIAFRTRLSGRDTEWQPVNRERHVELQDLPPGDYLCEVQASDIEGRWVTPTARLRIIVEPFFWQTWWFQASGVGMLVLVVCGTALSIQRVRHTRQARQYQQELALADERSRSASLTLERDASEAANRAKSEFLAVMSHEIRTPLNGILGMVELVTRTPLSTVQADYLESMRQSGELLLSILNDILDFFKIEAGKLNLDDVAFDARAAITEVVALLRAKAQEKSVELILDCPPNLPALVCGDPARFRQVLLNLLGNAVKFTEAGVVEVSADWSPDSTKDQGFVRVSVRDTGIGIEPRVMHRLFDRFTQADSRANRKYGGTGLGLAISKRLIEIMGGSIGMESQIGKGSRFWVDIRSAGPLSQPTGIPKLLEGRVVLLMAHHVELARAIGKWAPIFGGRMEIWDRVEPAAGFVERLAGGGAAGAPPTIALVEDGLAGQAAVMAAAAARGCVRVVMAHPKRAGAPPEAPEGAGFDVLVPKPILNFVDLAQAIALASRAEEKTSDAPAAARPAAEPPAARPDQGWKSKPRVLLVEDNRVNQRIAQEILRQFGCVVTPAMNGHEAVSRVQEGEFDLVFMDCEMPEMDGLEATRQIRKRGDAKGAVPIVALTAHAFPGDKDRCMTAGMSDYMTKPFRRGQLLDMIKKWCAHLTA